LSYILSEFDAKPADAYSMPSPTDTVTGQTPAPAPVAAKRLSTAARAVAWLSWVNLGLLLLLSWLLFGVSESWWFSSALTYAPRMPYLVPALALLIASGLWHRSSVPVNLIALAMVAVPIMGLSLPVARWMNASPASPETRTLKVISCNVQDFRPDFASVLEEISRFNPDVVAFQDARSRSPLLEKYFASWHSVRNGEFFIASRFPVKPVAIGHFDTFDRAAVVQYELELPSTRVMFFNVHQMTPRHGLRELDLSSPITQRGSDRMARYLQLRAEEAAAVQEFVEGQRGRTPTLIAGDFNTPCESSLYQRHWNGFQNAFNCAGTGYGYSFPCTRQYCWPAGIPWMRLDHILADDAWRVRSCFVGSANGSDHRLIAATLELP
jgi:endonuclease/exonuclease/phosphatase family metal-dependent hydrolase